jgi:hypothetical protein|tara:strand:+ start:156 stop:371 length:216 start_codon:yes stop_codon:yes gene_type:complete
MKSREHVIFDIGEEKFKYLQREDKNKNYKVDIIDLNKRLNETKKKNLYSNIKIISASLLCLVIITMISLKV